MCYQCVRQYLLLLYTLPLGSTLSLNQCLLLARVGKTVELPSLLLPVPVPLLPPSVPRWVSIISCDYRDVMLSIAVPMLERAMVSWLAR